MFAVNLRSLRGWSQCYQFSREPSAGGVNASTWLFSEPPAGVSQGVCSEFESPRRVVSLYAFKS